MSDDQQKARRQFMMAKALGFTNAITKLSQEERIENPSTSFGQDYNRLRASVESSFPELKEFLPPNADLFRHEYGDGTTQRYGEILSWCEQLYQLLSSIPNDP